MCRIPHLPNLLGLVRYQNGYADKEMYSTYRDLRELRRAAFRHRWRISSVGIFPPAAPFYCLRKSTSLPPAGLRREISTERKTTADLLLSYYLLPSCRTLPPSHIKLRFELSYSPTIGGKHDAARRLQVVRNIRS